MLKSGQTFTLACNNFQIYGPLGAQEDFTQDDFVLLEKVISVQAGAKLREQVKAVGIDGDR